MTESKIKDFKWELEKHLQHMIQIYKENNLPTSFADDMKENLDKYHPSLMFYGIYNAGKSTLLNAIFGEFKASVADVPETHQVTPYKWNGYDLVDTPGINGPEKDYKISRAELVKHDVILFVIDDSDSFDNKLVAEEIVQIIKNQKPLIIVLNNKQSSDEQSLATKRNKLYENIKREADQHKLFEVDKKYSFIIVNANSAFISKTESKELLLKRSKIEDLEILILQKLKEQSGLRLLLPPTDMLLNHARSLSRSLQAQLGTEKERQLLELISDLNERKATLLKTIQTSIRFEFHKANTTFYEMLSNNQSIDVELEKLNQQLNQIIDEELAASLKTIETNLDIFYNKIQLKRGSIQVDGIQAATYTEISNRENRIPTSDASVSQIMTKAVEQTVAGMAGKDVLIKTLETGVADIAKSTAGKAVMQQLGIKGLAPILAPIAPVVNVVILASIVAGIVSLFSKQSDNQDNRRHMEAQAEAANKQQQEALAQRMNALQELRTQLNLQLYKMEEETMESVNKGISTLFENVIAEIRKDLNMLAETNSKIETSLATLHTTITDLERFKMTLM